MKIILLGAPGAGKGTQAELIGRHFGLKHISTGDIFRKNIKQETPLGLKAKTYIDKGMLVPDEITIELVKNTLKEVRGDYMLDGFPRTIWQAKELDKFADIDVALNLDVDLSILAGRISGRRTCLECGNSSHISRMTDIKCGKCGKDMVQRKDDSEDVVKNRLVVYSAQNEPLIMYYKNLGKLVNVNGMGTPDEVWQEIKKVL